ncbi:hypothetical protein DFJ74DRAFT_658825 [Hyaloraphidium curvatum]|nr:hypothetical protein DFJ74DRAFT_658825 [Hyaloraphidium curvatum]
MAATRILIVGAGLSGLSAASTLAALARSAAGKHRPFAVTLADKGRSVGGRCATRRVGEAVRFDTGAQLFRIRDEEFQNVVQGWVEEGTVDEWGKGPPIVEDLAGLMADWEAGRAPPEPGSQPKERLPDGSCRVSGIVDSNVKYFVKGHAGMNGLAKTFGGYASEGGATILTGVEIDRLEASVVETGASGKTKKPAFAVQWSAHVKSKPEGGDVPDVLQADVLIVTAPMPQTIRLLDRGGITEHMDQRLLESIKAVTYSPTLAFLLPYSPSFLSSLGRTPLPAPHCFAVRDPRSPIYWVALQSPRRSGHPAEAGHPDGAVILMNADFSREHYEKDAGEIVRLGTEALVAAGIPIDSAVDLKKWRYGNIASAVAGRRYSVSTVGVLLPNGTKAGLPLVLASDAFSSDIKGFAELDPQLGVQRAVMSGIEVGRFMAGMLGIQAR